MEEWFGNDFTKNPIMIGPGSDMMREFEQIKRQFDGVKQGPYRVHLHMNRRKCGRYSPTYNEVTITKYGYGIFMISKAPRRLIPVCGYRAELVKMFEPVISRVLALIEDQLKTAAKKDKKVLIKVKYHAIFKLC